MSSAAWTDRDRDVLWASAVAFLTGALTVFVALTAEGPLSATYSNGVVTGAYGMLLVGCWLYLLGRESGGGDVETEGDE